MVGFILCTRCGLHNHPSPKASSPICHIFFFLRTCEGQNIKYRTCSNVVSLAKLSSGFLLKYAEWHIVIKTSLWWTCENSPLWVWGVMLWFGILLFERRWKVCFTFSSFFHITTISIKCKRFVINKKCTSLVLHPGLPSRCWWFPGPAVFSPCRRAVPGSVPRVAACVQRSRQPLRTQVQGKEFGSRGGAGAQGSGWDPLLHRVFGHVHQWSLPGRRKI